MPQGTRTASWLGMPRKEVRLLVYFYFLVQRLARKNLELLSGTYEQIAGATK